MLKKILTLVGDNTPQLSDPLKHLCAVCNSQLTHGGIEFKKLFSTSTFNLNHDFKNIGGHHVCSHCAVFFKRELWQEYCDRNNLDAYFPAVEGKERALANWVFFSHYFAKDTHIIVKDRSAWRDYLLNPPEPPFCFVISTVCKKHLIFKSEMAYNRENYPIRFEDRMIQIDVVDFGKCLASFEKLYNQSLSKSSIVSGDYNSSALLKADKAILFENENIIAHYRRFNPDYLMVCEFVGSKNE